MQNDPTTACAVTASETANCHQQLEDAEALTNDLKRLLVKYESTLDQEGIKHEIEVLERWMESYRRGLAAASKISDTGSGWLSDLRDKLKLAADEMQRLEGEGGNPASKEQAKKIEELLSAIRHIDRVKPNIEQMFPCAEPAHSEG